MRKSMKRRLFNGTVLIASASAVSATSAIIIQRNQLQPKEIKRIIDEIKEQISQVNNTIDKLDQNKGSVYSLKNAINEAEQKLTQLNQKFNEYNKEEYKTNNKINNEINNFKNSISELETKIKDSKLLYEQNKSAFDTIYNEAKKTSDEAKRQLKQTSEIDKPRLQEADDKLQQAIKKVEEAKGKVKDSQSHVDNLSVLNEELKQATNEVKKLIDELKNLTEEQKNNKYLKAVNKVNNELKDKINKVANLGSNVKEIKEFITDFESNIIKANGTVKIVDSEKGLSESVLKANKQLKDTISQSEQVLKNTKSKLAVISNNIDHRLNVLETKIDKSKQKIANSTDFDELSKEFENCNITNEAIKDIETKIMDSEYNKGLKVLEQLKVGNENNETTSLDKMKSVITKILEAANNLTKLQIESFLEKITLANTPQELENIRDGINLANKKEQDKEFIRKLPNLSKDEINESIDKINESDKSNLEKIKDEYSKINDEKGKLIEEIKTFDFTDEYKKQLASDTKSKNIKQATEFKEEIKQINDSKSEVKAFIDNIENKIPDSKREELKDLLTKAQSQDDVQNVQNKAQLEKAKQNAIDEISGLNIKNKGQLIDEINNKNEEAGIKAVVSKAKGDVLGSEKLKAESNINNLGFISENEKVKKIVEIKNTTDKNKEQINKIVDELSNKNKEKQDLFDKNIKDTGLFTEEFIDQTKDKLINEDNKDKYIKIKDDFVTLKSEKEELIKKLDDKVTYPYLGEKNIQNLKDKLKQATDSESIKQVEKQASQLNADKQKLINEVDKLEFIDGDKETTKKQIINANGKDEAQKIYDKLKAKSNKEKANSMATEYNDSINGITRKIEELKLYNQSITSRNLKQENEKLISSLEQQVNKYKQEYEQNLENNSIQAKGRKLKFAKDIIEKYVDTIWDSLKYINEKAENDTIKSAGWEEFYDSIIEHKNDFFDELTKTNLEDYSIHKDDINRIMPDVYLRTKYKIFKQEILRLIGDGKWRVNHKGELIISFMYLDYDKQNAMRRPTLDKIEYNSIYNNLTINWNTHPEYKSFANRSWIPGAYNYNARGISFKSGDDDMLELDLNIIGMPNDTWYTIPLIYTKEEYEIKKSIYSRNPYDSGVVKQNFDTSVNMGNNIKEQYLIAKKN